MSKPVKPRPVVVVVRESRQIQVFLGVRDGEIVIHEAGVGEVEPSAITVHVDNVSRLIRALRSVATESRQSIEKGDLV